MVIDDAFDGDAHVEIKQFGRAFVSNKFAEAIHASCYNWNGDDRWWFIICNDNDDFDQYYDDDDAYDGDDEYHADDAHDGDSHARDAFDGDAFDDDAFDVDAHDGDAFDGDAYHGDNDDLSFSSKEPLSKTERPSANSFEYHIVQSFVNHIVNHIVQ